MFTKGRNTGERLSQCLVGLLFLFIFLSTIFSNRTIIVDFKATPQIAVWLAGVVLLFSLLFFFSNMIRSIKRIRRLFIDKQWLLISILTLLVFFVQCKLVQYYVTPIGWDCGVVVSAASADTLGSFSGYVSQQPNNMLMLLVFHALYHFVRVLQAADAWFILDVFNAILIDISILLTVAAVRRLFGVRFSWIAYILCVLLFGFTPWLLTPYSDTLSMPFTVGVFYSAVRVFQSKHLYSKILWGVLLGLLSVLGAYIKPSVILVSFVFFGAVLITLVKSHSAAEKKPLVWSTVSALLSVIITFFTLQLFYSNQRIFDINPNIRMPYTHYLMLGMSYTPTGNGKGLYGAFNDADYSFSVSQPNPEEREKGNIAKIEERLAHFGIFGYGKFLAKKLLWITSDGTFFWGCEGDFRSTYTTDGSFAKNLICFWEDQYVLYAYSAQSIWLYILSMITLGLFLPKGEKEKAMYFVYMCVICILLFILLLEGRSRYLLNFLPFFAIGASFGATAVSRKLDQLLIPKQ